MKKRMRSWVGVGTSILTGVGMAGAAGAAPVDARSLPSLEAAAPSAPDVASRPPRHFPFVRLAMASEGGEGGEGGEAGHGADDAAGSAEAAFLANMALIRGHLSVGRELVEAGDWDAALVHFLHPSIEIYADVAEAVIDFEIDPFGDELLMLAAAVKEKEKGEFDARFAEVQAALDAAIAKAGGADQQVRVEAVLSVLSTAADEYAASLEDGRFVAVVEYQDSRGFVTVAGPMLDALQLPDDARAAVRDAMTELKRAWPAPTPPEAPVLEPGAVLAAVSQIELALSAMRP